jgi:hypothetical protein
MTNVTLDPSVRQSILCIMVSLGNHVLSQIQQHTNKLQLDHDQDQHYLRGTLCYFDTLPFLNGRTDRSCQRSRQNTTFTFSVSIKEFWIAARSDYKSNELQIKHKTSKPMENQLMMHMLEALNLAHDALAFA